MNVVKQLLSRNSAVWLIATANQRDARVVRAARLALAQGHGVRVVPSAMAATQDWSSWIAAYPLAGFRVAVLRASQQAPDTARLLQARAAEPVTASVIQTRPAANLEPLTAALTNLASYDWVVFTSANGVTYGLEHWKNLQANHASASDPARAPHWPCRIAAIGPATASALQRHGMAAALVSDRHEGESLALSLLARTGGVGSCRVLVIRALRARQQLVERLRGAGCVVDVAPAYETAGVAPSCLAVLQGHLAAGDVDAVLVTSASTVDNLVTGLGNDCERLMSSTALCSIGPITSARAREHGLEVTVEADPYTTEALVTALEAAARRGRIRLPEEL